MNVSLERILALSQGQLSSAGAPTSSSKSFSSVAPLELATPNAISFFADEKYLDQAKTSQAGVLLCSPKTLQKLRAARAEGPAPPSGQEQIFIECPHPYAAFAKISQLFFPHKAPFEGISVQAHIHESAQVDPTAVIGPFVFVGPQAKVGARSVLYPGVFLGEQTEVGEDCLLYPNVVVRERCVLGDRCILNPGAVVGGDGFGFVPTPHEHVKIPHIGAVHMGHDVELGANSTIDRGTLSNTTIGSHTKIDNLVMIAHNVQVGEFCFMAAQVGIAGSAVIGNRCVFGGQSACTGHVTLADGIQVGGQSGIGKSISQAGSAWAGSPARPFREHILALATLRSLSQSQKTKQEDSL